MLRNNLLFAVTWIVTLLCIQCNAMQWSSEGLENGKQIYLCNHDNLTLPWAVSKTTGERVVGIEWYQGVKKVAMVFNGYFQEMPEFSDQAELVPDAGLKLRDVDPSDSGLYSVVVNGADASGQMVVLRGSAEVLVSEGLMTEDGDLHARQSPVAVYNNATQQFQAQLTCGAFIHQEQPPFNVMWTTPAGQVVNSSFYQDGQFVLLLDNPVTGGSYTCHIPEDQAKAACLHGNQTEGSKDGNTTFNATIVVDEVKVRFLLLEAKLSAVVAENEKLNERVAVQEQNLSTIQGQLRGVQEELNLTVSFHATGLLSTVLTDGQTLIFPTVISNPGNTYNPETGSFVAPLNGTYCFLATAGAGSPSFTTTMSLMADHLQLGYAAWMGVGGVQSGSVHAVVQLTQGQVVLVKSSSSNNYFWDGPSAFSGFLVSPGKP